MSSDTMLISNLKLNNGSEILFAGASPAGWNSGPIDRVRIINPSIEGIGTAGAACGIDFGFNGVTEVTVTGGEIAGFVNAYCNPNNNINGASHNVIGIGNMYGNGILNYQWPAPVFSGCGANGSASGGARDGAVVMTCAGATMVMTFAQGSTDNGWGLGMCTTFQIQATRSSSLGILI